MNILDCISLIILALGLIIGCYRGFVQSILNFSGGLVSFGATFWFFPLLKNAIANNQEVSRTIANYVDISSIIGDLELSEKIVSQLNPTQIEQVVQQINLPEPLNTILLTNLNNLVFQPLGEFGQSVGDYVNQTLVSIVIHVLCFIVCFFICLFLTSMLFNLIRAVFRFPVLKHLDALVGGIFGLLLAILCCFIIFTALPLVQSVFPAEYFNPLLESSHLANFFSSNSLIISIMNK